MEPIDFTSVHDYLDKLFADIEPSKQQIVQAKKVYWRAYNTDLKRRKRKSHPCFQISFSKEELSLLRERLRKGESVSQYIHQLVLKHIRKGKTLAPQVNTALIEQQLFLISEYLRELLEFDAIDTDKIERLETYLQALETAIKESL